MQDAHTKAQKHKKCNMISFILFKKRADYENN